ncbi:PEP-CTERM/exosortase system-associated acyltransferase [Gayadomonas joobiniege]|uniref:PEP-CTERM/exosortase system-associated acyltransferase n=1 Tax=Gayadomonas joobiniege TaxID=1234606 RepID=UPI00036AF488|nr:PEP-CTERM/exosortase system-associated acyltransferase [Gayadomonas joobiniege]
MKKLRKLAEKPIIGPIVKTFVRLFADRKVHSISGHFFKYLKPELAIDEGLKQATFRVRHQVYCSELNFLPISEDGHEKDEFDKHSIHSVIRHKESGDIMGTVRLVLSSDPSEKLPIEAFCLNSIDNKEVHPNDFPREKICEISRLAIPENFRRRNVDKHNGAATGAINESTYSEAELRCFPFIAVGLYLTCASIANQKGIEHCFVMMEPRLARSLKFVGISFKQIGPIVNFHGRRAPYYISHAMLMRELSPGFRRLMKKIEAALSKQDKVNNSSSQLSQAAV